MGCDMYCVIEAHNKNTKNWDCFGVSMADRCYAMFSKIADVRNSDKEDTYIEPIVQPRGFPFDASDTALTWLDDDHLYFSATWLDRKELESLDKWLHDNLNISLWETFDFKHLQYLFDMKTGWKKAAFTRYDNLRIIFFFVN